MSGWHSTGAAAGGRIDKVRFAFLLANFAVRRYGPIVVRTAWPLLVASGICAWLSSANIEGDWSTLPPVAVLLFGGVGVFAAATARADALAKQLIQDLVNGVPNVPSRPSAVHGTIRALEQPLVSPFSGTPSVAFQYQVVEKVRSRRSRDSLREHRDPRFEGYHLAPSEIVGEGGHYRLLAFPNLTPFVRDAESWDAAKSYFEGIETEPSLPVIDSIRASDHAHGEPHERLALDLSFESVLNEAALEPQEWALPDATVGCVIGIVDPDARTITPPSRRSGVALTVHPGSPQAALKELESQGRFGAGCATVFVSLAVAAFFIPLSPLLALPAGVLSFLVLNGRSRS